MGLENGGSSAMLEFVNFGDNVKEFGLGRSWFIHAERIHGEWCRREDSLWLRLRRRS